MIQKIWHFIKLVFLILIIFFASLFFIFNSTRVTINLFPFNRSVEIRLFMLVVACLIIGFLIGIILSAKNMIKTKWVDIFKQRKIKQLEKKLDKVKKITKDDKSKKE